MCCVRVMDYIFRAGREGDGEIDCHTGRHDTRLA